MAGGMSFKAGRDMPPGMQEKMAMQIIGDLQKKNGVPVGKPLAEFLHPIDNYAGLKGKYLVFKADTGEQVTNCFVLRPDKDPAAVEALRAYAHTTDNEALSNDIYNWVGKGATMQNGWIRADQAKPTLTKKYLKDGSETIEYEESEPVLGYNGREMVVVYLLRDEFVGERWYVYHDCGEINVTHWWPNKLPAPPEVS